MTDIILDNIKITVDSNDNDYEQICNNLYEYNVRAKNGLLKKPGKDINLYLKDETGKVLGGLFCETWSYGLYIDVFWIADDYRNKGYGKIMIAEAERLGKELGCIFSHTCTFTYQSPEFYTRMSYEVFAVNDEYPEDIKQFFLKNKL
ncbi:GNAT family N-acetyltransferase [Halalkalibacter sp. APA_J-10(15)]|uniref:GNAT family N-acetyltransferase n=1 Tax=Halalkalibacter sp. APA_J-10(15) TaxID=2933805 RepID=UPI001FF461C3|nr:GNAT family N-acetyltransferase [Halalkalibacter sp. APA_J-10(15)]MCK0473283.1 GNAT family N-acetyltransferase [Halalkalibacter sp. APA_J-10(15)]